MSEIISASSLILTIIALTFNSQVNKINDILDEEEYDRSLPSSRNFQKRKVLVTILLKAVPLFLAFWILFYILLPKSYNIIQNGSLNLWDFDTVSTLFVFVEIIIFLFASSASALLVKLFMKVNRLN